MKFKPIGDMVLLELSLGGEVKTDQGIIYEKTPERNIWGKVIALGPGTPLPKTGEIPPWEFEVGDEVFVQFTSFKGTYKEGLYSGEEKVYHLYNRYDILCVKEK